MPRFFVNFGLEFFVESRIIGQVIFNFYGGMTMKKCVLLACLWIGGIFVSALGATITVIPRNGGDGWLFLDYSVPAGEQGPAAMGLTISLSNGAKVAKAGDWYVDPAFNFFPDYAYQHPMGYQIGAGHPFSSDSFPKSGFGIAMSAFGPYQCGFGSCKGDINGDGIVDLDDAMLVASNWLRTGRYLTGDLNGDRKVNLGDAAMLNGYQAPIPSGTKFLALHITDGGAGFTNVTFGIDPLRGGAFAADGTAFEMVFPGTYQLVIPEPATLGLLGLGAVLIRRRSR
jgi:hypothetical protein